MENAKINANLGISSTNNYESKKSDVTMTNPISANKKDYKNAELLNSLDALALMNRPLVIKRYAV